MVVETKLACVDLALNGVFGRLVFKRVTSRLRPRDTRMCAKHAENKDEHDKESRQI
jgi:hypothetical protein